MTERKVRTMDTITLQNVVTGLKKMGATLISVEPGRKIVYECKCGNEAETFAQNIVKGTQQYCNKCLPRNKNELKNILEEVKLKYKITVDLDQEYVNNKTKIKCTCDCGFKDFRSLSDIRRNRRHKGCTIKID